MTGSGLTVRALPPVTLDPGVHVSPYALLRWIRRGRRLLLVDVRDGAAGARAEGPRRSFRGAVLLPVSPHGTDGQGVSGGWEPPPHQDVVFFDEDGARSTALARTFQAAGHLRVRSLFGGLSLYRFALDPQVVGEDLHLIDG